MALPITTEYCAKIMLEEFILRDEGAIQWDFSRTLAKGRFRSYIYKVSSLLQCNIGGLLIRVGKVLKMGLDIKIQKTKLYFKSRHYAGHTTKLSNATECKC
jgi:hypothetical protein